MTSNGASREPTHLIMPEMPAGVFSPEAFETVFGMSEAILGAWQAINEEWIALMRAQLQNNRSLAKSLVECRDPLAAVALHLDGAHATVSRCVSAATKASTTVSSLASQALASARQGAAAA